MEAHRIPPVLPEEAAMMVKDLGAGCSEGTRVGGRDQVSIHSNL